MQVDRFGVTEVAATRGSIIVVAGHAGGHRRPVFVSGLFARFNIGVAQVAVCFTLKVALVTEDDIPGRVNHGTGFIGVAMTLAAGFVVVDIMAIAANIHVGVVAIIRVGADIYRSVAGLAIYLLLSDMKCMREDDFTYDIVWFGR